MDTVFVLVSSLPLIFSTHFALTVANNLEFSSIQPTRLVTKLIHRDSIVSPYYRSNDTVADRTERTMKASLARLSYLYAKIERDFDINDLWLNLHPSASEPLFLVNFSIIGPMFDPSISSTYGSLSCKNIICRYAPSGECDSSSQCVYNQTYVEGLPSVGVIATEQLIFGSPDEGTNAVNNVIFGCSHRNGNYKDTRFTGVFGLGSGITSVVNQMGSKFSYCIGNIADPDYSYNQLVLSEGANMEGYSTPLDVVDGHYQVILEGISVGETRLVIDPSTFQRTGKERRAIIDSGTAPTWLAENEYRALENRFLTPFMRESFLCYRGKVGQDLVGFPAVTFHFAEGADLVVDTESMFYQATPNIFCMAVRQASVYGKDFKDFSVIGLMAQQYYNVAYDLNKHKLFFQRIDCELLDE
ncbi:aspartyl protease UND [Populus alba x Populus x berolinensis]|uniref:Aspartyl protease UND n=1 Tax=Populus alba x Populus x berolinensis TaxID=444605 RepID=A0AAD6QPJ4_9ROSI|nr:aspartyl protease UND [Populus alba x Populus x berolinensis]